MLKLNLMYFSRFSYFYVLLSCLCYIFVPFFVLFYFSFLSVVMCGLQRQIHSMEHTMKDVL